MLFGSMIAWFMGRGGGPPCSGYALWANDADAHMRLHLLNVSQAVRLVLATIQLRNTKICPSCFI